MSLKSKAFLFFSIMTLSASLVQAQEIVETKLDLGETKLVVQDLGNGKISTRLTLSPRLVSSNHTIPNMTGELKLSAQLGVWTFVGGKDSFFYSDSSLPQKITTTERGVIEESFLFSKDELMTQKAPICLHVVASIGVGSSQAGASKVVCAN